MANAASTSAAGIPTASRLGGTAVVGIPWASRFESDGLSEETRPSARQASASAASTSLVEIPMASRLEGNAAVGIPRASLFESDDVAPRILVFLRLRDIVAFHFGSPAVCKFCRSSSSGKLVVPMFVHKEKWLSHIDTASLETLYADDAGIISTRQNDAFAVLLEASPSLQQLYCTRNPNMHAAKFSRALHRLPHLSVLDLSHNRLAIDDNSNFQSSQPLELFFCALPPRLLVLDLSYNLLRDQHVMLLVEGLEARHPVSGCGLQQLLLRSNLLGNLTGYALSQLMGGPAGADLWRLDLRTNQVEGDGACIMLKALQVHTGMKEMRVGYNKQNAKQDMLTAKMATVLLQRALSTTSANRLELLDLNNVRVGSDGMRSISIALAGNTLLRRLDLAFNSIGIPGAEALSGALEHNQFLEQLDLRDNEIEDEGALALTKGLKVNYALRRLQLARNGIGARGALALRSAIGENARLVVDFGASGESTTQLQAMLTNSATMANLHFLRTAEREHGTAEALTSNLLPLTSNAFRG